jgi:hypothetical protein
VFQTVTAKELHVQYENEKTALSTVEKAVQIAMILLSIGPWGQVLREFKLLSLLHCGIISALGIGNFVGRRESGDKRWSFCCSFTEGMPPYVFWSIEQQS